MTSHYEVESSTDGSEWGAVGGLFRDLYNAIFKRDQMRDAFEDVNFRVVSVRRDEIDVELVEEK